MLQANTKVYRCSDNNMTDKAGSSSSTLAKVESTLQWHIAPLYCHTTSTNVPFDSYLYFSIISLF